MVMAELLEQITTFSLMHNGKMDRDMDTLERLINLVAALNMNAKMAPG